MNTEIDREMMRTLSKELRYEVIEILIISLDGHKNNGKCKGGSCVRCTDAKELLRLGGVSEGEEICLLGYLNNPSSPITVATHLFNLEKL